MIDTKIKILTNNVSLLRYFQNSLFCLIKLSLMRKIIIVMLIIVGFASCEENGYAGEDAVYTVENVTVSSTTMTFKFRGVENSNLCYCCLQ